MSISFAESLERSRQYSEKVSRSNTTLLEYVPGNLSVFRAGTEMLEEIEEWIPIENQGYKFYAEYSDEKLSTIDDNKNIILNPRQTNITQETKSQYIPFQMQRFYDGFDLATTKIEIYFVNKLNQYGTDYPVNVHYSADKIKFAWLVDSRVTAVDGIVRFEIRAVGNNSKGEMYVWKTRPNSQMTIIQSLTGAEPIIPDDQWQDEFISQTNDAIADIQNRVGVIEDNVSTLNEDVGELMSIEHIEITAEDIDNMLI